MKIKGKDGPSMEYKDPSHGEPQMANQEEGQDIQAAGEELSEEDLALISAGIKAGALGPANPEIFKLLGQVGPTQDSTVTMSNEKQQPVGLDQLDAFAKGGSPDLLGGAWNKQQQVALDKVLQKAQNSPTGQRLLNAVQQGMNQAHIQQSTRSQSPGGWVKGNAPQGQQPTGPAIGQQRATNQSGWVKGNVPQGQQPTGPKIGEQRKPTGPKQVRGMDVFQDIGGNLFGPRSLRPSQRSTAIAARLNKDNFNQMKSKLKDTGKSLKDKPLDTLQNLLLNPFGGAQGALHNALTMAEQRLGYQKEWRTPSVGGQVGPRVDKTINHNIGDIGSASHQVSAGLDAAGNADAGLKVGAGGVMADAKASGRVGPMAQHQSTVKLKDIGTLSMNNVARADLQTNADGNVKVGIGGASAQGNAGYRFGPAVESSGTFKHDLVELGYGGRAALESKGNVTGNASLDARGLRAMVEGDISAGGEIAGGANIKTDLGNAAVAGKAEAKVHASGYGEAVINPLTGAEVDLGGKIGATAGVEGKAGFQSAGINLGGEQLNLNGQIRGRAEVTAQAEGRVSAKATLSPPRAAVDIGGKAFAGAKAEVEGTVGLGDFVKLRGRAGAWAGAGAEGKVILGYDDGKLRFGLSGGAAVGYGAGLGGVVEIDVKKIANAAIGTGLDIAEKGIRYALNPMEAVKDAEKLITDIPQKAVKAVESVAKTGSAIVKAASSGLRSLAKKLFG